MCHNILFAIIGMDLPYTSATMALIRRNDNFVLFLRHDIKSWEDFQVSPSTSSCGEFL